MRTLPSILLLGLLAVPVQPAEPNDHLPPPSNGGVWQLVWHDEFDGDKLDESKWGFVRYVGLRVVHLDDEVLRVFFLIGAYDRDVQDEHVC